jgi:hypothetical protein
MPRFTVSRADAEAGAWDAADDLRRPHHPGKHSVH